MSLYESVCLCFVFRLVAMRAINFVLPIFLPGFQRDVTLSSILFTFISSLYYYVHFVVRSVTMTIDHFR